MFGRQHFTISIQLTPSTTRQLGAELSLSDCKLDRLLIRLLYATTPAPLARGSEVSSVLLLGPTVLSWSDACSFTRPGKSS